MYDYKLKLGKKNNNLLVPLYYYEKQSSLRLPVRWRILTLLDADWLSMLLAKLHT